MSVTHQQRDLFTSSTSSQKTPSARKATRAASCVMERLEDRQLMSASSLDATFGTGGKVVTGLGSTNDVVSAVAVDLSGRTYVLGTANEHVVVTRYTKAGKLDTSFSGDGRTDLDTGINENAVGISVVGGKVTVVTNRYDVGEIIVSRLNMNGSYDTTFDGTGKRAVNFECQTFYGYVDASQSWAAGVAVQNDGKIVVAGTADLYIAAQGDSDERFAICRLKANGSFDNSFGHQGMSSMEFWNNQDADHQEATCMALQNDGKILVGGRSNYGWGLGRFNANGSVDYSFGNSGHVTPNFGSSYEIMTSLDVDSNGKIITGGFITLANSKTEWALAGFTAAGLPDNSFAGNGREAFSNGNNDFAVSAVKFRSDHKILALGHSTDNSGSFQLARLNPDGTFDNTFGTAGITHIDFASGANDEPAAMAIGAHNKIIVAGTTAKNGNSDQAVARVQGDVPLMSIVITDNAVVGKHPGHFRIERYDDPYAYDDVVLHFTVTGTAKQGTDYTFSVNMPITFHTGQSEMIVDINPVKNYKPKTAKTVNVVLNPDPSYDIFNNTAPITIWPS